MGDQDTFCCERWDSRGKKHTTSKDVILLGKPDFSLVARTGSDLSEPSGFGGAHLKESSSTHSKELAANADGDASSGPDEGWPELSSVL